MISVAKMIEDNARFERETRCLLRLIAVLESCRLSALEQRATACECDAVPLPVDYVPCF